LLERAEDRHGNGMGQERLLSAWWGLVWGHIVIPCHSLSNTNVFHKRIAIVNTFAILHRLFPTSVFRAITTQTSKVHSDKTVMIFKSLHYSTTAYQLRKNCKIAPFIEY